MIVFFDAERKESCDQAQYVADSNDFMNQFRWQPKGESFF
jgi:hypothetical protein